MSSSSSSDFIVVDINKCGACKYFACEYCNNQKKDADANTDAKDDADTTTPHSSSPFSSFVEEFSKTCKYDRFMVLNLFIENGDTFNSDLKNLYSNNANLHNHKLKDSDFIDAGFDLMMPYNYDKLNAVGATKCVFNRVNKLNLQVKCSTQMYTLAKCWGDSHLKEIIGEYNTGFYMYPRSSISKTCLRMANSVGIIDSGYRGNLIAMVDAVYEEESYVNAYDKLFQICAPGLVPVVVNVVNSEEELGAKTERGEGGFGSTGR